MLSGTLQGGHRGGRNAGAAERKDGKLGSEYEQRWRGKDEEAVFDLFLLEMKMFGRGCVSEKGRSRVTHRVLA